jgi:FG-GAP-like repeat/FG-GAP repeat
VTRAGFETRTLVFGLAMMLMALFGCEGPGAAASHDAQSIYNDLTTDHGEAFIDARIPLAVDAAVDVSSAPQDLQVIHDDLGYQVITDFGPPRQTRRNCPAAPMGEAGIEAPRLRAPGTARRVTSHRPTLEWILPPGVTGARVEICRDPCCTNPVTSFDAEGSQGRPAQALPAGVMFWRVRGKVGERVGRETSFTWEFGVRRRDTPTDTTAGVIHDFNGDGFDDVGVSYVQQTNSTRNSALRVFYGSPSLLSVDNTQTIPAVGQGLSTAVGDFNGDGFADVLSASVNFGDPRFYAVGVVAYGGRDGLRLDGTAIMFHTAVLAVGDFNGDGLSDVASADSELVNDNGHGPRRVKVIYGSSDGLGQGGAHYIDSPAAPYRYARFDPLASPGDLDGDGFEELLVGSSNLEISISSIGRVYVLAGASSGVRATAARTIDRPVGVSFSATGFGEQGWAIGDINGDRVGDFAILEDFVAQVNLYTGGGSEHLRYVTYLHTPTEELTRFPGLYFGSSVSSGDVDADGVPELVVGCVPCTEQIAGVRHIGQVYLYEMDGRGASVSRALVAPWHEPNRSPDRFGVNVMSGIDINGDGFDDVLLTVESWMLENAGTLYVYTGVASGLGEAAAQLIGDQLSTAERRWFGARLAQRTKEGAGENSVWG